LINFLKYILIDWLCILGCCVRRSEEGCGKEGGTEV
jgi:hypothetical protein